MQIAEELANQFDLEIRTGLPDQEGPAVGPLADYRMEIYLAAARVFEVTNPSDKNVIYTHSLLDSTVYPAVRSFYIQGDPELYSQEEALRWEITMLATMRMLYDTFAADLIILVPDTTDQSDFNKQLGEGLKHMLDIEEIEYHTPQSSEECAKIVEQFLSESDEQS